MYVLRDFYSYLDGLRVDETFNPIEKVNLERGSQIDGYFVEEPDLVMLIVRRPVPVLAFNESQVPLDSGVRLMLEGSGRERRMTIRRDGGRVDDIGAPEPVFITDDPYGVDDFYSWLASRLESEETRNALLQIVRS